MVRLFIRHTVADYDAWRQGTTRSMKCVGRWG